MFKRQKGSPELQAWEKKIDFYIELVEDFKQHPRLAYKEIAEGGWKHLVEDWLKIPEKDRDK